MHIYRVISPIVCVEQSSTGMQIAQIATGEFLSVPALDGETGSVEIVYRGRNVSVFIQDLRNHAERAEQRGA